MAVVSLLYVPPAFTAEYTLHPGTLGLTYDPITVGSDEAMGLLGFHALLDAGDYAYLGLSGFGAVNGERGGFLTGGYSMGLRLPLPRRFNADLSLFLGAGGGGGAPQGSGLMIREQAGIGFSAAGYQMGAGISRIRFPDGKIDSVQPYLSLQIPFTTVYAPGWLEAGLSPALFSSPLYDRDSSFALSAKQYRGGSLFRSRIQPSNTISTIGVEWRQRLHGTFFYTLSGHGAVAGSADGYAEVMAGGGWRWRLGQESVLGVAMALGSGGGGNVDTGGGALGSVTLNLKQPLTRRVFINLQGGYAGALEGGFGGSVVGVALGTRYIAPATHGEQSELALLPYAAAHYRLRLVQQRYLSGVVPLNSQAGGDNSIELSGLQIDRSLGNRFYLTGQAMAARSGEAGGYASGMVGSGLSLPLTNTFSLSGELLVGAAGGGGIKVGDGRLLGGTLSLSARLSDALELALGSGRIVSQQGELDARQLTLALAYRFTRPER